MESNELRSAINTLKAKRDELQKQINSLNEAISSLESNFGQSPTPSPAAIVDGNYSKNMPASQKVLYALKQKNRFLHFRQIAEFIAEIEGIKTDRASLSELSSHLSTSSQNIKKNGTIARIQHGAGNQSVYWGSPKWLNEEGKIKEGYEVVEIVYENDKPQIKIEL